MKSLSQAEYGEIRDLYQSIYAPEQVDEEIEISEEELTEIIEEAIIELLEEGYTAEEIEESFDDEVLDGILIEAKVTYGSDTESPEEARARRRPGAKARLGKRRSEARRKAVTGAVTAAREKASAAKDAVNKRVKDTKQQSHVGLAKYASNRKLPLSNPGSRTQTSDGRKKLRKAVAKDMASRLGKALVGSARNTDTSKSVNARFNRAVDKAKGAVKGAKKGLKNRIADAAGSVGDKAIAFSKKMRTEEVETYDVVVEFLCDQGIAEDLQEAQWMMVNEVDSEDIATILEAYGMKAAKKSKKKK